MTASSSKTVGVIGGMGPEATVDLMRRIIAATPAEDDADHIHVIADNNPKVPSRIKALIEGGGEDPAPTLIEMARRLETAGADFLVMPCNTAHHYLPAIADAVDVPVFDMVTLAAERLAAMTPKPEKVGMLASPAVRLVGLYSGRCAAVGLEAIFPESGEEAALLDVIRAVKADGPASADANAYSRVAAGLAGQGADALLIACTELTVLGPPAGIRIPVVDAVDVLVEAIVDAALRG